MKVKSTLIIEVEKDLNSLSELKKQLNEFWNNNEKYSKMILDVETDFDSYELTIERSVQNWVQLRREGEFEGKFNDLKLLTDQVEYLYNELTLQA